MMVPACPGQVAVFWDFENCRPSNNISGGKVVDNIRRLVQGYGSITTFRAYIDLSLDCANLRAINLHSDLQLSGVSLVHCPHNGKKDVADKMMIADMLAFAIDRLTPACIVLVTGDRDFSYAAAILRLRGYCIIIISPSQCHASLKIQADEMYDWQSDVLESVDIVVDTGRRRSDTISSTSRSTVPPLSSTSAPPAYRLCSCANTTIRTGTPRNEALLAVEQQPQTPSLRRSHRPSSSCDFDSVSLPSVGNRYNNEASASIVMETPANTHATPHYSTGPIGTSDLSSKSETASAVSEIDSEAAVPDQSLTGKPANSSFHVPTVPGTALRDRAYSSTLGSARSGTETGQDVPTRLSHGSRCDLSGSADDSQSQSYSASSLKVSSVGASPTVNQPCNGFESDIKPAQIVPPSDSSTATTTSTEILPIPALEDRRRFLTLITLFIERRAASQTTRILSSEVATQIRKRDPQVYEKGGVTKLKEYIEAARKAGVIISPSLNNEGSGWVEINPVLYSPALSAEETKENPSITSSKQSNSSLSSQPATEWIYAPLTSRLRSEAPTYRLFYSSLGMFFKIRHPDLYKRASANGLVTYLEKAAKHGIIQVGKGSSPGSEWAELMPAYRGTVYNGSSG